MKKLLTDMERNNRASAHSKRVRTYYNIQIDDRETHIVALAHLNAKNSSYRTSFLISSHEDGYHTRAYLSDIDIVKTLGLIHEDEYRHIHNQLEHVLQHSKPPQDASIGLVRCGIHLEGIEDTHFSLQANISILEPYGKEGRIVTCTDIATTIESLIDLISLILAMEGNVEKKKRLAAKYILLSRAIRGESSYEGVSPELNDIHSADDLDLLYNRLNIESYTSIDERLFSTEQIEAFISRDR